jgi:hypothetical protein
VTVSMKPLPTFRLRCEQDLIEEQLSQLIDRPVARRLVRPLASNLNHRLLVRCDCASSVERFIQEGGLTSDAVSCDRD